MVNLKYELAEKIASLVPGKRRSKCDTGMGVLSSTNP